MTCIAYRDGVLAADTLTCSEYGSNPASLTKIFRFQGALYGISGKATDVHILRDWLEDGCKPPSPTYDESNHAIRVSTDGRVSLSTGKIPRFVVMNAPYFAIGSGADHAMGAMWKGATAVEAVECAKALNRWCGGDTNVLLLRDESDVSTFPWAKRAKRIHTGGPWMIA